ncbi:hypothetical protein BCR43DRAFT_507342 [Syncephalastrum racemosum]|uniref:Uncharacterized protein n=1 Tax=Syncephalastrum racemosum TaxID=13706 RepID=A0A1X2H6P3_SYNRA|nr:hypothetical protein BCR43DRAFT_507342 [Syncephalastrum racemosum]
MHILLFHFSMVLSLISPGIKAYCIYNHFPQDSGIQVNVRQHSGYGPGAAQTERFMKENINPGEKACCPWDVVNCNANSYDRNAHLTFAYDINYPGQAVQRGFHQLISCPAGGAVSFGDYGSLRGPARVFGPDSHPFPFKEEYTDAGWQ